MVDQRARAVRELADYILLQASDAPARVALDGRGAAGKTTLSAELAEALAASGRQVIRASIDDFHRPRLERYRRGRMSAEGYYRDARDLPAVISMLLAPLGPGGDRRIRTISLDLASDEPVDAEPRLVAEDAVLVLEGTFLQRPELAAYWDVAVYVRASAEECLRRALERDRELLGGEERTRAIYAARYEPAWELYEGEAAPEASADVVFDNERPERPLLEFKAGSVSA